MIKFDETEHKYFDGDKELIPVTKLLKKHGLVPDYSNVPIDILNAKAERGTLVHKEIETYIKTGEMGFTVECQAFADYIRDNNIKVIASEETVSNDVAAGTLDLLLDYGDGCLTIADIKTTYTLNELGVSWQESLYKDMHKRKAEIKKAKALHFDSDGNIHPVDIELRSQEEVDKLFDCERNGKKYIFSAIALDSNQIELIREASSIIEKAKLELANAEKQIDNVKQAILEAMENNGIKTFENDYFKITYIAPIEKTSVDTAKLKKELPEIANKYQKTTTQKASVRITLKGDK